MSGTPVNLQPPVPPQPVAVGPKLPDGIGVVGGFDSLLAIGSQPDVPPQRTNPASDTNDAPPVRTQHLQGPIPPVSVTKLGKTATRNTGNNPVSRQDARSSDNNAQANPADAIPKSAVKELQASLQAQGEQPEEDKPEDKKTISSDQLAGLIAIIQALLNPQPQGQPQLAAGDASGTDTALPVMPITGQNMPASAGAETAQPANAAAAQVALTPQEQAMLRDMLQSLNTVLAAAVNPGAQQTVGGDAAAALAAAPAQAADATGNQIVEIPAAQASALQQQVNRLVDMLRGSVQQTAQPATGAAEAASAENKQSGQSVSALKPQALAALMDLSRRLQPATPMPTDTKAETQDIRAIPNIPTWQTSSTDTLAQALLNNPSAAANAVDSQPVMTSAAQASGAAIAQTPAVATQPAPITADSQAAIVPVSAAAVSAAPSGGDTGGSAQNNNTGGQAPLIPGIQVTGGTQGAAASGPKFSEALAQASAPRVLEQVSFQMKNGLADGSSDIHIRLDPAELGKLDIKLNVGADGKTNVTIIADTKQALDMLQRDSQGLTQALNDAGLKTDGGSLNFNLRGQDQGQQQSSYPQAASQYQKAQPEDDLPPIAAITRSYTVNLSDGLDIKI